jgi:two-component system, sensor histidine kinase PdtaS
VRFRTLATDRAISLALVITELVTNAINHAYKDSGGVVSVSLARNGDVLLASVRDDGRGVAEDFLPERSKGLGMRIVTALSGQLNAELKIQRPEKGTTFELRIPLRARLSDAN